MTITQAVWDRYVRAFGRINRQANAAMRQWIEANGTADLHAMTERAYGIATAYGEAAAALSAEMYDAVAAMEGAALPAAEMAETATWSEVSDAVYGVSSYSTNTELLSGAVERLVKRAGADTTVKNAIRDRAEWAWVPSGDSCAFCATLASNGWLPASEAMLEGGHAEHIHAHCDCEFAIRHDRDTKYASYDPEKYEQLYYSAPLDGDPPTADNRVNALRREFYAENRDRINAQKRAAYAKRKGNE